MIGERRRSLRRRVRYRSDVASSHVSALTWRPLLGEDAEALHALRRAVETADALPFRISLAELQHELGNPDGPLELDTLGAFTGDGRLVAFGRVRARLAGTSGRVNLDGDVHPAMRRQGLGTRLLAWSEARARALLAEGAGGRGELLVECDARAVDRPALFRAAGFQPVRWSTTMRRQLEAGASPTGLPAPYHLATWAPELDAATHAAFEDAFQDHWGHQPLTAETWRHDFAEAPTFRPDLSRLALDGDRVAALVLVSVYPDDEEATGVRAAWLDLIGTRRPDRRRGLASGLVAHTLAAAAEVGLSEAALGVDMENPSGALGLYERLGFSRWWQFVHWAKPCGEAVEA